MFIDVFFDAVKDSLTVFPFIFLVYVLMEMLENARGKNRIEKALSGPLAPLFASLSGVVPECGFSVGIAKLFDNGFIKAGTLIAAFLAASDEGIIILMGGSDFRAAGIVAVWKIVFACFFGCVINLLPLKLGEDHVCPNKNECIECGERHESGFDLFFVHPFIHAAKTFIYLLGVNMIFGLIIAFIGEDKIAGFITGGAAISPLLTAIVGLVPNCASSIIIAEGYLGGFIGMPALISGLGANAGMGLLILFKRGKKIKYAFAAAGLLVICAVVMGYAFMLTEI